MTKVKTIPAVTARVHLGDIMKRAFRNREHFIVEKSGLPMVAILNANEYFELVQEREARFAVLDRIKIRIPEVAPEEIERNVQAAVQAVRGRRA